MTPVYGHCLCGETTYEIDDAPYDACHCHCRSCQLASGAAFVTWASVRRDSFRPTGGHWVTHHSSPGVERQHCGECGTPLTYAHSDRANEIDITVASLVEPGSVQPMAHIWLQDKQPWVEPGDGLPQFQQGKT